MKPNMGSTDRIVRALLAIVFAYLFFNATVTGTFGAVLLILAVVFALTSAISFCPLYKLLKFSTR